AAPPAPRPPDAPPTCTGKAAPSAPSPHRSAAPTAAPAPCCWRPAYGSADVAAPSSDPPPTRSAPPVGIRRGTNPKENTMQNQPNALTPDQVNAIVRDMDDPRYPSQIT